MLKVFSCGRVSCTIFLIAVVSCTSEVIRKPFQCLRTGNHITTLIERDTGVLISHHSSRVFYL